MKKNLLMIAIVASLMAIASCAIPGETMTTSEADLTYELLAAGLSNATTASSEANARAYDFEDLIDDAAEAAVSSTASATVKKKKKYANESGTCLIASDYEMGGSVDLTGSNAGLEIKNELKLNFQFKEHTFSVTNETGDITVILDGRFRYQHQAMISTTNALQASLGLELVVPFPGLHITATQNGETLLNHYVNANLEGEMSLISTESSFSLKGTINDSAIDGQFMFNYASFVAAE